MARKDSVCMWPAKWNCQGAVSWPLAVHVSMRLHSSHEVGSIAVGVGLHASTLPHCMLFCTLLAAWHCGLSCLPLPCIALPQGLHCLTGRSSHKGLENLWVGS